MYTLQELGPAALELKSWEAHIGKWKSTNKGICASGCVFVPFTVKVMFQHTGVLKNVEATYKVFCIHKTMHLCM